MSGPELDPEGVRAADEAFKRTYSAHVALGRTGARQYVSPTALTTDLRAALTAYLAAAHD